MGCSWQLNRQKSESCFQLPTFKRLLERLAITPAQEKGCRILTTSENAILFRRTLVATAGKVQSITVEFGPIRFGYADGAFDMPRIALGLLGTRFRTKHVDGVSPYNIISAL